MSHTAASSHATVMAPVGRAGGSDADLARRLAGCAAALVELARAADWRGADPYDGLYWKWPAGVAATRRGRQALVQLHARAPIDVRAWRRKRPPRLAKTLALFSRAALLLANVSEPARMEVAGRDAASVLNADRAAGQCAWGYSFPVQTRWSYYGADQPNIVVTSFAADALAFAARRLDEPAFRTRAHRAAEWILDRLLVRGGYFGYHESSDALIHNANLLGAATVHRTLGSDAHDVVCRAVEITLDAQRSDGAWSYGEGSGLEFVDSFHTAYVLGSLMALGDLDPAVRSAVQRGAQYWAERFFDASGRALLWPDRRYPEDGHSAGTALSTLAQLVQHNSAYTDLFRLIAGRALESMVDGGRAVHRRYRWGRTRVRYLRWCDGHMAVGMATGAATIVA